MNKTLLCILIPCLLAFALTQAQFGQFGGLGGYGYPQYAQSLGYYNYGRQQTRQSNLFALFLSGFLLLFALNLTGGIAG